jgi:hypothetical protein
MRRAAGRKGRASDLQHRAPAVSRCSAGAHLTPNGGPRNDRTN